MPKPTYSYDEIKPNKREVITNRLKFRTSARAMLWLYLKFQTNEFVYPGEMRKFLGISHSRASQILSDFAVLGLIERKRLGSIIEIRPAMSANSMLIEEYVPYAKKTLELG